MPLLHVRSKKRFKIERFLKNPIQLTIISFAIVIFCGTVLLIFPFASASGQWTSPAVTLFTSTSATCVTGLVLVDTGSYWSTAGQAIILLMIQIGGLSLATVVGAVYTFSNRMHSWQQIEFTQESTSSRGIVELNRLLRWTITFTLGAESIGAAILIWRFWPYYGSGAVWRGIFQSVSAFCNAGFDLHGTAGNGGYVSLIHFNNEPIILLVTGALIVTGGLGFMVWLNIFTRKKDGLAFHSNLVLKFTSILLIVGTIGFLFLEFNNTSSSNSMGNLSWYEKPLAALFQSITTRTAGFNSIDQFSLSDSSKFLAVILMFIGAAPASTGGGIKVTTMAAVVSGVISDIRRKPSLIMSGHYIRKSTNRRANTIFALAMLIVMSSTIAISVIENDVLSSGPISFLDIWFEVGSAFGTVGLTSIGTSNLHQTSQFILIVCMFLGRVSPVAFALSLSKPREETQVVYPEATILL
ncbi:MAG: potassium transporter TrkG [Eubacteriales bacterium]|nr:potassium transporter TrkG [Eubacteriales bacterium]MDD4540824.1 potassium transporter TrkG [Eubacteriales bacterium]